MCRSNKFSSAVVDCVCAIFAVCSCHVFKMAWQLLVMKLILLSLPWLSSTMLVHDMKVMLILG